MPWGTTFRVLFILYCVEAGVFLLLSPWSPRWDEGVIQLANLELSAFLLRPTVRGAVSGFGLVHLVWGAHDLDLWLSDRRRAMKRRTPAETAGPE